MIFKQRINTPLEHSNWGSPLVVIPKSNEGVRLAVDYKTGVNERLVSSNNPIPKIKEILENAELKMPDHFAS